MDLNSDARERLVILISCLLFAVLLLTSSHAQSQTQKKIVVFGDSLVAGYGLGPSEDFPAQLQIALNEKGYATQIINAGVSGDTTSGGLSRLDWSIGDGVDAVIVELGANDALRGLPPELTRKNLNSIVEKLTSKGAKVVIAGMLAPPNMGTEYAKAFNAIYPDLAEKGGHLLYPFFLDGVAAVPSLNQPDGIHPTAEGIKIMVGKFMATAEKLMAILNE